MVKRYELYQYVSTISKGLFNLYYTYYIVHNIIDLDQSAVAFSFLSLSGVSIIFDLGLSQIFIKWTISTEDKVVAKKSIFSWFLISALLSALIGFLIGFYVLNQYDFDIWLYPFLTLIFSLVLNILFSGYVLSVEADGRVIDSYKIKMISSLVLLSSVGVSQFFSFNLYLLGFSFGISSFWVLFKKDIFLINLSALKVFLVSNIRFIRQTSLVWVSGFLFWNMPILITTKLYSSTIASAFALIFNLLNSINFFSLAIFSSNRAIFSKLLETKLIKDALYLFKIKLLQIFGIFFLSQIILAMFIFMEFEFTKKYTQIIHFKNQYYILSLLFSILLLLQIIAIFMRSAGKESFYKELLITNLLTPAIFCLGYIGVEINAVLTIWLFLILFISSVSLFKFRKLVRLMNSNLQNLNATSDIQ